jgi:hypothetical protein
VNDLIDINKFLEDKKTKIQLKKFHASASFTIINNCLAYLNMNNLAELEILKVLMKRTLKELKKIENEQ